MRHAWTSEAVLVPRSLAAPSSLILAVFLFLMKCFQTRHSTLAPLCFARLLFASDIRCLLLSLALANFQVPPAVVALLHASPAVLSLSICRHTSLFPCCLLALACAICFIIRQSISIRLSLMISISTVHSGSLIETSF